MFSLSRWLVTVGHFRCGRTHIIIWPEWRGVRYTRWSGVLGRVIKSSTYLGWIEVRRLTTGSW